MDAPKPRRGRPAPPVNPDAPADCRRLHQLCIDSGLTLTEIAARAGLGHARNLTRVLTGDAGVTFANVRRILDAIGRRWADLDDPAGEI